MFSVAPTGQEFNLEPGNTYTGKITILNSSDAESDFLYNVSVTPYSVIGEEYNVDLATKSNYSMLTEWVTVNNPTGSLKPGEKRDIEFSISVPESAPAGGQYASILVTENNAGSKGSGLSIDGVLEIASLIYASVSGETIHDGGILENNIPGFIMTDSISVGSLLVNNGNVHEPAITLLQVKNLFTGEVILSKDGEGGRHSEAIMPETTRRIDYKIDNLPIVGLTEVTQTIYYDGQTSVVTKNVIICPLWFITLIVTLVGAVIATIVVKRKKRKINKSIL